MNPLYHGHLVERAINHPVFPWWLIVLVVVLVVVGSLWTIQLRPWR